MQLDQYVHAEEAGLLFLTEGFVEAWKPVIDGEYTDGEPVEVIAYLGTLRNDPDFEELMEKGKRARWLARAFKSLAKPLQAGMSIGLDSAGVTPKDSMTYKLAEMLRGLGVRVYIEPRPDADKPCWFDYPIITTQHYWYRSDPDRHPDAAHKAANDQLTGEKLLIMIPGGPNKRKKNTAEWQIEASRKVLDDGLTPAAMVWRFYDQITLENLLIEGSASFD